MTVITLLVVLVVVIAGYVVWRHREKTRHSGLSGKAGLAQFQVARFSRALAQSTNDGRRAELQANLDYWTAIRDAEAKWGSE